MSKIQNIPKDLPTDWKVGQIISPDGVSVGLTPQHGYNKLNERVNEVAGGVNEASVSLDTVERDVEYLKTSGVQVADPIPIDASIIYKGPKSKIPPNFELHPLPFSNPNLLINPDFQVWQRGTVFSSTSLVSYYTADRWFVTMTGGNKVQIAEDKSGFVLTKSTANQMVLRQLVECEDIRKTKLINKNVTLSFLVYVNAPITFRIGVGSKRKDIIINTKGQHIVEEMFLLEDSDFKINAIDCIIFSNTDFIGSINFKYVKLEIGDMATPFISRSYGEELILCKRYYSSEYISLMCINDWGTPYTYPIPMRSKPTIQITEKKSGINNSSVIDDTRVSASTVSNELILFIQNSYDGILWFRARLSRDAEIY